MAQHPGELTYGLFFDQNLSYSRYSTVIAPNPLLPGLAQRTVLTLQDGDVQQYQVLRNALTGAPTSKERKQELASFLSTHLEKPHERKAAIDRAATPQDDLTTKRLKYVLLGTISTNGLELQCLEYSLVKPKPWRQAIGVPKTTRRKLQSVHSRVSQGFPENQGQYIIVGIDPGIHRTATATILDATQNVLQNVVIPRTAHTYPTKKYQEGLQSTKAKTKGKGEAN